MVEDKVNQLLCELDKIEYREGAKLQVFSECDGDVGGIVGNQNGYLCFGVEMLKAAIVDVKSDVEVGSGNLPVDLSYLFDPHSAFLLKWFSRQEKLEPILNVTPKSAKYIMCGVLLVIVLCVVLFVVGLITAIRWALL